MKRCEKKMILKREMCSRINSGAFLYGVVLRVIGNHKTKTCYSCALVRSPLFAFESHALLVRRRTAFLFSRC